MPGRVKPSSITLALIGNAHQSTQPCEHDTVGGHLSYSYFPSVFAQLDSAFLPFGALTHSPTLWSHRQQATWPRKPAASKRLSARLRCTGCDFLLPFSRRLPHEGVAVVPTRCTAFLAPVVVRPSLHVGRYAQTVGGRPTRL